MIGSGRKTFSGGVTLSYSYKNLTFRNQTSIGSNKSEESPYGSFSDYARQQPYNAPWTDDGKLNRYFDGDRKSTRLNSSHNNQSRMPSSA